MVVTDGFTGNVSLKTIEGSARAIMTAVKQAFEANLATKLSGAVVRKELYRIRDALDPEEFGGAFLVGMRAPVIISHGSSYRRGIAQAVRQATRGVMSDLLPTIERELGTGAGAARGASGGAVRRGRREGPSGREPQRRRGRRRDARGLSSGARGGSRRRPHAVASIETRPGGHCMTREEVFGQVKGILVETLSVDEDKVTEEARFQEDLETDSLDLVELVMTMEERFGIKISDEEAAGIKTVGDAIDFVMKMAG